MPTPSPHFYRDPLPHILRTTALAWGLKAPARTPARAASREGLCGWSLGASRWCSGIALSY